MLKNMLGYLVILLAMQFHFDFVCESDEIAITKADSIESVMMTEVIPVEEVFLPSEWIDKCLDELEDPKETLDSIYRTMMFGQYLQTSPRREVESSPGVEEVLMMAEAVGLEYSEFEGRSIEKVDEDGQIAICATMGFKLKGEVSVVLYKPRMQAESNLTKEAIQELYEQSKASEDIQRIELRIGTHGECSLMICEFS